LLKDGNRKNKNKIFFKKKEYDQNLIKMFLFLVLVWKFFELIELLKKFLLGVVEFVFEVVV